MAVAYMQEFSVMGRDANGNPVGPLMPPIASQTITYTTSTQSSALNAATTFVQLWGPAAFRVAFGSNPTAVAGSFYVGANMPVILAVPLGGNREFAFYDGSS